jgi:pilus assembly protein CpaB
MALVVSVIVTSFLYTHIKRQYAMTARPIKIVAAARPLEPGKPLTAEDLTLASWPANVPLSGAAGKPESFLGRIVLYPVAAQEPIREQLLAAPGAAVGLTAKIPDGMRAVAIQTNEVNNVSGFLFPGCHVDALVTFRPASGKDSVTVTVLQNVEVLSTGEKLQPDPAGKPQNVKEVTVLLTPDDAQKLVLASNQGTVQFVLRNGSDQAQAQQRPVELKDLQGAAPQTAAVPIKKAAPAPKVAGVYEVETYDGTKKGVVKF